MELDTAIKILNGDKSPEELVNLIKKLNLAPVVNTFEENQQLKAAKTLLSHKKRKKNK